MISIIIPAYNEESNIKKTLRSIKKSNADVEIIVVDGGSSDATVKRAKRFGKAIRVIQSKRGRANQMNAGARVAKGDVFYFLHADSIPPPNVAMLIEDVLKDKSIVGGGFLLRYNHSGLFYRFVECSANTRVSLSKIIFGDQSMFVRKSIWQKMGGFADIQLMEDVDFSRRLKKEGSVKIFSQHVISSARRFEQGGPLRVYMKIIGIMTLYFLGAEPKFLSRFWN